jgi:hypothetical protein
MARKPPAPGSTSTANPDVALSYRLKADQDLAMRLEEECKMLRRENVRLTGIVHGFEKLLHTDKVAKLMGPRG